MENTTRISQGPSISNARPSLSAKQIQYCMNVIDGSYLLQKKLDCSQTEKKMVFLVEEIESRRQYVLKFYTPSEYEDFKNEVDANTNLLPCDKVQRAVKVVTERENMTPFIINGKIFPRYSYILLPYCSKGTLIDLLMNANKKGVKLSSGLALYFFKQLILCLDFLHNQNGLAHLDIKPDNIVLTNGYNLSFIDFGHTHWVNQHLSRVVGTDSYMAPEVREAKQTGQAYDPEKVDIFTLGVTFFILIFGQIPFFKADFRHDDFYSLIYKQQFDLFLQKHPEAQKRPIPFEVKIALYSMLYHRSHKRPSIKEILSYPWVQKISNNINDTLKNEIEAISHL